MSVNFVFEVEMTGFIEVARFFKEAWEVKDAFPEHGKCG